MRVLMTTRALAQPGGSETYLATVARELRSLGHEPIIYSPVHGTMAHRLRVEGFELLDTLDICPVPDVTHVQHATTAFRVRGRFPDLPMVFVSHSSLYDIEDVPILALPQSVVVLSDVVGRRVQASAWADTGKVVRLHQPIAIPHDDPALPALPARPGRGVLLGARTGPIAPLLQAACDALGIELGQAGGPDMIRENLSPVLMQADIVFGVGRTLLEGLALGRAGFLIDDRGMGGFIDAENYARFEAGAFATFDPEPTSVAGLIERIERYEPSLGRVGRELIRQHHRARQHALDLVEAYRAAIELGPPPKILLEPLCALASQQADDLFLLQRRDRAIQWAVAESERQRADTEAARSVLEASQRSLEAELQRSERQCADTEAARSVLEASHRSLEAELQRSERQRADTETARSVLETSQRSLEAELQRIRETKTMRWSRPLREVYRRLAGPGTG